MSDTTTHLGLPYLMAAQAQKHVTHNEALRLLDAMVQLAVIEARSAPPDTPPAGARYLVSAPAGGLWAGWDNSIAFREENAWLRLLPKEGWVLWDAGAAVQRRFDGAAWLEIAQVPDFASGEIGALGIATGADATNRLAVAAPASLFTHDGAGHQLKVNKASAGDTATLLFQSGWSGRAELGLAGEDDFSFKVSPDGAAWHTALSIARSGGAVSLPAGAAIQGHAALHRGNLLGAVSQTGGLPTGAVIERAANANGDYVRFADGTQLCYSTLNLGDATRFGNGTFDNLWRTDVQTWTHPAAFALPPLIAGFGTIPSTIGNARRMVLSFRFVTETATDAIQAFRIGSNAEAADCTAYMIAIGRWF